MSLSTPPQKQIIAIIGAAVAGPTLALQILSHPILSARFKPILYDASPSPSSSHTSYPSSSSSPSSSTAGAAVAISANGLFPLYNLGLRQEIEEKTCEVDGIRIWRANIQGKTRQLRRMKGLSFAKDITSHMRVVERGVLQEILLDRVKELGGEVRWGTRLVGVENIDTDKKVKLRFENGEEEETVVDLLVGADGAWSEVRRHILQERHPDANEEEIDKKWTPDFMGMSSFYGVSDVRGIAETCDPELWADTHGIWLDRGMLSTSPLPGGKIRWDLMVPGSEPPPQNTSASASSEPPWSHRLQTSYPRPLSISTLASHARIPHPVTETFSTLLKTSLRIIHVPLYQRAFPVRTIQNGLNVVLLGDAARLMLPSSGQGTAFAIEDATVLADALLNNHSCEKKGKSGFGPALEEYAARRIPRSEKMATVARYAAVFGMGESRWSRWLRDWGTEWLPSDLGFGKKPERGSWPFDERVEVEVRGGGGGAS